MPRPAASSPPRPRLFRKSSAAYATGTIGFAGFEMPPSPSMPCCSPDMRRSLRLAGMAVAGGRRTSVGVADHVWAGRRATLDRVGAPWLPGYEHSSPVRIGNAAAGQFQLDVYGEVIDAMHESRKGGIERDEASWYLQRALLDFSGVGLAQAGPGDLGSPRAAPAVHPFEGHGLGRVRPRGPAARRARPRGARSSAGKRCGMRSTPRYLRTDGASASRPSRSPTARTNSTRPSCRCRLSAFCPPPTRASSQRLTRSAAS